MSSVNEALMAGSIAFLVSTTISMIIYTVKKIRRSKMERETYENLVGQVNRAYEQIDRNILRQLYRSNSTGTPTTTRMDSPFSIGGLTLGGGGSSATTSGSLSNTGHVYNTGSSVSQNAPGTTIDMPRWWTSDEAPSYSSMYTRTTASPTPQELAESVERLRRRTSNPNPVEQKESSKIKTNEETINEASLDNEEIALILKIMNSN